MGFSLDNETVMIENKQLTDENFRGNLPKMWNDK